MIDRPTPIERAFQLAQSGDCDSLADIRKRLKSEGFSEHYIYGVSLYKQLRQLMRDARNSVSGR
jgi:hypothetical protein